MCFRWFRDIASRPATFVQGWLTSFTRAHSVARSALGFSLAGWGEPNYAEQHQSPPLAAYRALVVPADPLLLSGPGAATGNLDVIGRALPWASFTGREIVLFNGSAKRPRAPAPKFARDSIECTRSTSNLLSSVDPGLYCDTNGPIHAPSVLSLSPSTGSMFASSLAALQIVGFLVFALQSGVFHTACALRTYCCALQ